MNVTIVNWRSIKRLHRHIPTSTQHRSNRSSLYIQLVVRIQKGQLRMRAVRHSDSRAMCKCVVMLCHVHQTSIVYTLFGCVVPTRDMFAHRVKRPCCARACSFNSPPEFGGDVRGRAFARSHANTRGHQPSAGARTHSAECVCDKRRAQISACTNLSTFCCCENVVSCSSITTESQFNGMPVPIRVCQTRCIHLS